RRALLPRREPRAALAARVVRGARAPGGIGRARGRAAVDPVELRGRAQAPADPLPAARVSPPRGLDRARRVLASGWLAAVFGTIYLVSQIVIANIADHVGPEEILALQTTGFSASDYRATFARWDAA